MASKQTERNARYQKKAGWISKSYKLKKDIVESYAEACEAAGVSQAGKLMELMKKFIEEQKEN